MKHVIIGAGAAGITAAKTIRSLSPDAQILVISEDEQVHSRCMLHKVISHERDAAGISFVPQDFFEANRIQWMPGTRVKYVWPVTSKVQLENDETIDFDRLLIAAGAESFIPPVGDFRTAKNVFGLRHLSDALKIDQMAETAERVLIVGSGLVGMDAAYALLERGKQVTVVEMAERILPLQLDETAGAPYKRLFEAAGCRFILGKSASETVTDENGNIRTVILSDGTELPCDLVIVAAGVRAALSCVEKSGLKADRFLEVNEYMETSAPGIYAAGDIAGLSGIWPNAMKQGQTAAFNMCGQHMKYLDRYAMKNTMNFYGLVTLSLGRGVAEEGDLVLIREDRGTYKKAIFRDGRLDSILLQGDIDYSGIYQYMIKNQVKLSGMEERIFDLTFADFYDVWPDGQYDWKLPI